MKGNDKHYLSELRPDDSMTGEAMTWQNEVKREITESQLIHLNRQANSICDSKWKFNSNRIKYLEAIISENQRDAREIQRMLKVINNEEEIHE